MHLKEEGELTIRRMRQGVTRIVFTRCFLVLAGLAAVFCLADRSIYSQTPGYAVDVQNSEVVLFPFDRDAIPFRSGVQLNLQAGSRYKNNPVLRPGSPGQPDSVGTAFYGTVIPFGDQLRMWYLCAGDKEKGFGFNWLPGVRWRVCYAESKDGINWTKPNLGLVSYGGSTHNNLVALNPIKGDSIASVVIYDPEDSDPKRRFKMIYENHGGSDSAAYSPDGLTWTNSPGNPVIRPVIEPSGLIKYDGYYYVVGHGAFDKRVLVVDASADFDHWTDAVSVGFRKDNLGPLHPRLSGSHSGEQVHLGAALWNRGNVILGLYGQWHGPSTESDDRRDMRMDIGFVVSHDCLHYHEPIPDFKMIPGDDEKFPVMGFAARLVQGQGFLNLGDQTLAWYSLWGPGGAEGVRLATWTRDRLGYFAVPAVATEGQLPVKGVDPQFISCPIRLHNAQTKVYVNVGGLGEYSNITVELLDDKFQAIPGFSGADSVPITKSGIREQVTWRNADSLGRLNSPIRLRIKFGGLQIEHARVYAVYLK